MPGVSPLICAPGFFLLEVTRVRQQDLKKIACAAGAVHAASKARLAELWKIPRVIDMRMRENDGSKGFRVEWKAGPVAFPQFFQSLEQPAIYEDLPFAGFEQIPRAGDGSRGAKKRDPCHSPSHSMKRSQLAFSITNSFFTSNTPGTPRAAVYAS